MAESLSPLTLVRRLCDELAENNINYCHWKSNEAIDRSASGDNDLDLLVHRSDAGRFTEILFRLGFKQLQAPAERWMPGVQDYYGYDADADKFVHVQPHYQLILGHDRTKNYRLPIEAAYLSSATRSGLFRLPAPEFEYVVFVIRMTLKHATWDALAGGQGNLSISEERELAYLEERVDPDRVSDVLAKHLPFINLDLFEECLAAIRPGLVARERARAARHLERSLEGHARRGRAVDAYLRMWRRAVLAFKNRVLHRKPKYRLASGGGIIAILGGDGAGKSTAVEDLYRWLAGDLDVRRVHLGKPPKSLRTTAVNGVLRIARAVWPGAKAGHVPPLSHDGPLDLAGYTRLAWLTGTAHDRLREYRKARRFAINGGLVISDRYPHPSVRLMEAPQINRLMEGKPTERLARGLAGLEERYHRAIGQPEAVAVLKVHPEIAVQRKTDETADSVRTRSGEIWQVDWRDTSVHVVDASQPREEVLTELKAWVWSVLE